MRTVFLLIQFADDCFSPVVPTETLKSGHHVVHLFLDYATLRYFQLSDSYALDISLNTLRVSADSPWVAAFTLMVMSILCYSCLLTPVYNA
jgi:hypothetical protein